MSEQIEFPDASQQRGLVRVPCPLKPGDFVFLNVPMELNRREVEKIYRFLLAWIGEPVVGEDR